MGTLTKNVYLPDGRPLYLTIDDFVEKIATGEACFVCSRAPKDGERFTKEHILPAWLLRQFDFVRPESRDRITLGNGRKINHPKYTVPCCTQCNALMGAEIEQSVRYLFQNSFLDFNVALSEQPGVLERLYCWLALILFKSIYKDKTSPSFDKAGRYSGAMDKNRDWSNFHHLNTTCRAFYPEITIRAQALGSILVFEMCEEGKGTEFAYSTFVEQQGIFLKVNKIGIIAFFDDAGFSKSIFGMNFSKPELVPPWYLTEALEVFGHLTVINEFLEFRPSFGTWVDSERTRAELYADVPRVMRAYFDQENDEHLTFRGRVLDRIFRDYPIAASDREVLRTGAASLLPGFGWHTGG